MLSQIEALEAVAQHGTLSAAARRLRLTQGAVTKRIQSLEREVGELLLERTGRGVVLTPRGAALLSEVGPLLADLRRALDSEVGVRGETASVAFSESLLASWGAELISELQKQKPLTEWILHAHRSPLVIDRVRSGEVAFGICAGSTDDCTGLTRIPLGEEELAVLPSRAEKLSLRGRRHLELMTIETGSSTWRSIRHRLKSDGLELRFTRRLQSFGAVIALARSGLGHGLVPRPLAESMGVPGRSLVTLPRGGISRPIQLVARPRTLALPFGAWLRESVSQFVSSVDGPLQT